MGLLIALRAGRVRLEVDGDDLIVDGPRGVLTEELWSAIAFHKQELLRLPRPYINGGGELISPAEAPPQYHWQPMAETLRELNAPPEVWRAHTRTVEK